MKTKLTIIFLISSVALLVMAPLVVFGEGETSLFEKSRLPGESLITGRIEESGTFFEIKNSEYLNITLKSTEEIKIVLESIPRMISLNIETTPNGINSTELTIEGLEPNKTYYKYQNSYKNKAVFISDKNGNYNWVQDLTQPHHIWIQEAPGLISKDSFSFQAISAQSQGVIFLPEQCSDYGSWDGATSTCTLNQDLTQSVEITEDNITLDCNGHKITGSGTGYGIYLNNRRDVTIKNCTVTNFGYGVSYASSARNTMLNSNIYNNSTGVLFDRGNNNIITKSIIDSNRRGGIHIWHSTNNTVTANNISNNGIGIRDYCCINSFSNNTINSNQVAGIYLGGWPGGWAWGYQIENNNISNNNYGIYFANIMDNSVSNNYIDSNQYGIYLQGVYEIFHGGRYMDWKSMGNRITDNHISTNNYGLYLGDLTTNNKIYHNDIINNINQTHNEGFNNLFDNGYPAGGNYWDDYNGNDVDGDGIGDTPYIFTGDQDNYPFMEESGWEVPLVPTYNVAVILAEINDVPHTSSSITAQPCKLIPEKTYPNGRDKEYYQDLVYCVADYHRENSFGTVNLNFTIYDNEGKWFKTDKNEQDYLGEEDEFVINAIGVAKNSGINLSNQDIKIVVKAGEEKGGVHYVVLDESTGQVIDFSKIIVGEKDPVGIWTHETGHFIGTSITPENTATPDLYKMGNVRKWDLMARGAWNGGLFDVGFLLGNGTDPAYMSSFTKEFLQWLNYDIHPKSAYNEYWINSLETSNYGDAVFRYNLCDNTNDDCPEYYILEARNRNLKTWDSSLPKSKALVLYYVDSKGLPKYGYDLEMKKMMVENWTVTIPSSGPAGINDGILNPLINETYRDLDNLVKFSAITDRTLDDKYEIQARIEEITYDSFFDNFWGAVLRPKSFLKEKIKGIFHSEISSSSEFYIANSDSRYLLGATDSKNKNSNTFTIVVGKDWAYYMKLDLFEGIRGFSFNLLILLVTLSFLLLVLERKLFPQWKSEKRKKIFKVIFRIVWIFTLITFLVFITFSIITRYWESKKPAMKDLKTIANPSSMESDILPDLDLHLYCDDGKHIGMNYQTGQYENQIPGAIVSGDNQDSPEWIFVPKDITDCHYVVSSYDNQKFLEENPEIAQQIKDTTDSYEIYARYIDPQSAIYTSATVSEDIDIGENLEQPITGTTDISVSPALPLSVLGDVNGDCQVNTLDLRSIRNKLNQDVNMGANRKADLNEDGRINILDLIAVRNNLGASCKFSEKTWPISGDANLDYAINILDFIFIRNRLNQDPKINDNWQADVNEDGKINILDLIFVWNHLNVRHE